jgi:hypothetical protein
MVVYKARRFLLLLPFFVTSFEASSQVVDLHQQIKLKAKSISLDSILLAASQQTGVVFSYSPRKINAKQVVNLGNSVNLIQLLSFLEKRGLKAKLLENYIVLSPQADKSIQQVKELTTTLRVKSLQQISISNKREIKSKNSTDQLEVEGILYQERFGIVSVPIENLLASFHGLKSKTPLILVRKNKTKVAPKKLIKPDKSINYFGRLGLSSDETTLLGAALQFGVPRLYASFSANTSFESTHLRYGIGTGFKLTKASRFLLNINLGNVHRSGQFTDSINVSHPISVKSELSRICTALEFSVGKKIKIQAGPMFNYLTTAYYINSLPSSLQLFKSEGDHLFYAIKPPYIMTNTFSPNTNSNTKTWVGVQVNFFYAI